MEYIFLDNFVSLLNLLPEDISNVGVYFENNSFMKLYKAYKSGNKKLLDRIDYIVFPDDYPFIKVWRDFIKSNFGNRISTTVLSKADSKGINVVVDDIDLVDSKCLYYIQPYNIDLFHMRIFSEKIKKVCVFVPGYFEDNSYVSVVQTYRNLQTGYSPDFYFKSMDIFYTKVITNIKFCDIKKYIETYCDIKTSIVYS